MASQVKTAAAIAVAIASLTAASGDAARQSSWQRDVDRVFSSFDRRDSPGCAVAIYKDGKILYERGYGMADLEHDVPISPDTVFYIGSVSKQFTAFAAALAIQQGRMGLDDPIRKHLPELDASAQGITIRHLVHHTSGLRDFYTLLAIAGRRQDSLFDNAAVLRLAARQKGLNFPPGDDYLYSNTGYALLATIVGRAAGTSFGAFADENIFKPLGMTNTRFGDDQSRLVRNRAYGYSRAADGALRLDTPAGERVGAGGLFTTVRDLLRWDENFYDARVGGRTLIDQVQVPGALSNGKPLTYAWGLDIGTYRGQKTVEHGGSLGGYRAHLVRFPEQHVSVASLCNLASITPGPLTRQVAAIVIGERFTQPSTTGQPRPGPGGGQTAATSAGAVPAPADLAAYAGVYVSDEIDAKFTIAIEDGKLTLRRDEDQSGAALLPVAADQFRVRTLTLRFARDAAKTVDALLVDAGRVRGIRFVRAKP
jgi:CubicO group peptidase (beta-lactamase class C family)